MDRDGDRSVEIQVHAFPLTYIHHQLIYIQSGSSEAVGV